MPLLVRKANGQPIRDAMRAAGLSGPKLAAATRAVDPTGRGVSAAGIGRIAGRGRTAGERTQLRTGWLIAEALDERIHHLFSMSPSSTSTVERSIPDAHEG